MTDFNVGEAKTEGWGNCAACDWFYNKRMIEFCPMCRHHRDKPKRYTQPRYEPPGL